ncbi:hypothetical protein BH24DEI2_BH24DEI2_16530 [soil metagenome]
MKKLRIGLALLLLVLLTACGGNQKPIPPGPDTPAPGEIVLLEDTEVIDEATRAKLVSFDGDTLRFSETTPQLARLNKGSVLVSEPSEAAPFGYLRRVSEVRRDGAALVIETKHASLDEAIAQGSLSVTLPLTPKELDSNQVLLENLSLTMNAGDLTPLAGDAFDFELVFEKVLLDVDGNDQTKNDQMTLNGKVALDLFAKIDVDISWFADAEKVEFVVGVTQKTTLSFKGFAALKLKKEIKVAQLDFATQTFFVGPVPVVMTPSIELIIGIDGDLRATTTLTVSETATLQAGARWTNKKGWRNISEADVDFGFTPPSIDGAGTKLEAYAGPKAKLKFYGVLGPHAFIKVFAKTDVKIPRDPIWKLSVGLKVGAGFDVDLPIVGKLVDLDLTVIDVEKELTRAENSGPSLKIIAPTVSGTIPVNRPFDLLVDAKDPEDGTPAVAWSSDLDGALGAKFLVQHLFETTGTRLFTVVATDKKGLTVSKTVSAEVVNTPPSPVIEATSSVPATVQTLLIGSASDPNDLNEFGRATGLGVVACERLTWNVTAPDTLTANDGCEVGVVFNQEGARTVTVNATDLHGATSSVSVTVNVTAPPPNPAPIITSRTVTNDEGKVLGSGDFVVANGGGTTLTLEVGASDPEGEALSVQWEASSEEGGFIGIGSGTSLIWNPNDSFTPPRATGSGSLVIRAAVSDGTTTVRSPDLALEWGKIIE